MNPGARKVLERQANTSGTDQQHQGPHSRLEAILGPLPVSPVLQAQSGQSPSRPQRHCSWLRASKVLSTPLLHEDTKMNGQQRGMAASRCRLHTGRFVFMTIAILPFWQREACFSGAAESNACFGIGRSSISIMSGNNTRPFPPSV